MVISLRSENFFSETEFHIIINYLENIVIEDTKKVFELPIMEFCVKITYFQLVQGYYYGKFCNIG